MSVELKHELREFSVRKCVGDLPASVFESIIRVGLVAWDIETSGLDWKHDKIATCQLYAPSHEVHLVQFDDPQTIPPHLRALLTDSRVLKIFHHAMFDLRFMASHWNLCPTSVGCTKIASKLLNPMEGDHSLQSILRKHLNVRIGKEPRVSDWLNEDLTREQLEYAASDVIYLPRLFDFLKQRLEKEARWELAVKTFDFLPTRVQLDLIGAADVYNYG